MVFRQYGGRWTAPPKPPTCRPVAPPRPESDGSGRCTDRLPWSGPHRRRWSSAATRVGEYLGVTYEDTNAATHRFLANVPGYQRLAVGRRGRRLSGRRSRHRQRGRAGAGADGAAGAAVGAVGAARQAGRPGPGRSAGAPGRRPASGARVTCSAATPRSTTSPRRSASAAAACSAPGAATDAAQRWHDGDYGPESAMARSTKRVCRDCGFLLPLAGSLGTMFGVCGNEMAADGHVVDFTYGCGAHSDTPAPAGSGLAALRPVRRRRPRRHRQPRQPAGAG